MSGKIFDPTIGALNTSMNLRLMRHNVISSNIANADTPGYKAKEIDFEQAFRDALGINGDIPMDGSHPEHLYLRETDAIHPEIYDDPNGEESLDGNTVNRSMEMAKMSENEQLYNASVELLKKKLGMLKYGITEGGGNR